LGRELQPSEVRDCFGCHSSNSVSNGLLSLSSLQPGITCEHCHAGSSGHLLDALQGIFDSVPRDLKRLSSEEILDFCGQCHRTWETVVKKGTRGPANVRFQPYRLANSKCFNGADPRINCIACHDPHQNLVREASSYDANCTACHSVKGSERTTDAGSSAKLCPVATKKCTNCHMPKVQVNMPGGLITFTDHTIRLGRPGEPYPN